MGIATLFLLCVGMARATDLSVATVEEYFEELPQRFVPAAAEGVAAVVQWEVEGSGTWHAVIREGHVAVRRGAAVAPDLLLRMGSRDLVDLANGDTDGTTLYVTRRLTVDGPTSLARRLAAMLPSAR